MEITKTVTMKELPESERPYEKCGKFGPGSLSDAELLAVILKSGCRGKTAYDMAVELLRTGAGKKSLVRLTEMSVEELTSFTGIGRVKAIQILCIGELARRICKQDTEDRVTLGAPSSVAAYFMPDMRYLQHEEVRAAFFDTKNNLLREVLLSRGTVNASVITPREIFIEALKGRAVSLILVHNHPSGDPAPSDEDVRLTRRVRSAGEILGIRLMDHIIIGDNKYISLVEQGLI